MVHESDLQSPVILFDGVCNLCNSMVRFIIKRDKKNIFRFSSLQSSFGQQILHASGLSATSLKTIILLQDGKVYTKSTGALLVAKQLSGGWSLLYFLRFVPLFIRNGIYDWIAGNRYRWFGKKQTCMVPSAELKARFIE